MTPAAPRARGRAVPRDARSRATPARVARRAARSRPALTHVDRRGARMVDVGGKPETVREAVARAEVAMSRATLRLITARTARKGDVLTVAQVAGIAAAKRTWDLIPLCHPIPLAGVAVDLVPDPEHACVRIEACVRTRGQTGAEMEALTAVAVAGLTVYDMVKAAERGMIVGGIRLVRKSGGASGAYVRAEPAGRSSRGARRRRAARRGAR